MLLTLADLEDIELELASVVDKWFDFGVQLSVDVSLLNGIRKDFSDPAVCLHQVCIGESLVSGPGPRIARALGWGGNVIWVLGWGGSVVLVIGWGGSVVWALG